MNTFHRSVPILLTFASILAAGAALIPEPGCKAAGEPPHGRTQPNTRAKPSPGSPAKPGLPASPGSLQDPGKSLKRATAAQRKAAMKSITSQLNAFRKNDYDTASTYQSSELKGNFPSIDAFRKMMQSAYPEFANYRSVEFGPAFVDPTGKHLLIQVKLTGADALTVEAAYLMVLEDKMFRVEGVLGGHTAPRPTINA